MYFNTALAIDVKYFISLGKVNRITMWRKCLIGVCGIHGGGKSEVSEEEILTSQWPLDRQCVVCLKALSIWPKPTSSRYHRDLDESFNTYIYFILKANARFLDPKTNVFLKTITSPVSHAWCSGWRQVIRADEFHSHKRGPYYRRSTTALWMEKLMQELVLSCLSPLLEEESDLCCLTFNKLPPGKIPTLFQTFWNVNSYLCGR